MWALGSALVLVVVIFWFVVGVNPSGQAICRR
jgi:hypothetical protein